MKRTSVYLLCMLVLLTGLVLFAVPFQRENRSSISSAASKTLNYSTSNASSSQESSEIITTASAQSPDYYTVREYNGHIGIFKNNDDLPYEEIQIDINVFPEIDRRLLQEGIRADSKQKLNEIIEDYEG